MKWYFEKGLNCIFHVNPDLSDISNSNKCHYSFYYMTGYVLSLFMLQITLTYLMQMKKARNLRTIFALMVPITFGAFMLGGLTNPIIKINDNDPLNIVSTLTCINQSRNIFVLYIYFRWLLLFRLLAFSCIIGLRNGLNGHQ